MRLLVQFAWMYFELVLRHEVPNPFAGDILLFISSVPALAALILETLKEPIDWKKPGRIIDFVLLLLCWLFRPVALVLYQLLGSPPLADVEWTGCEPGH